MSVSDSNIQRRERQRRLAMETIDLTKDPYFFKNHLGSYECRLCLTLHMNEGSYLAHTQGKKHQSNLQKRIAREAKQGLIHQQVKKKVRRNYGITKIGRPGYKVIKDKLPGSEQRTLLFEIEYKEILEGTRPDYRIFNAFEQKMENPDNNYLYLLFAADPYETICFKIPNKEIERNDGKLSNLWDKKKKIFTLTLVYA